ncbi:hypothetical protein J5N97_016772 [Dioscorea zingiberensis]|uniref:Uncharacterized protein n=1 Tax=Dioscorea zingiberensis TaxID=325984 RepID=A0A9D5HFZ4_9LILI|nr:hypothetical protein J5N97_016772 [Dioscorea zingiberensis]
MYRRSPTPFNTFPAEFLFQQKVGSLRISSHLITPSAGPTFHISADHGSHLIENVGKWSSPDFSISRASIGDLHVIISLPSLNSFTGHSQLPSRAIFKTSESFLAVTKQSLIFVTVATVNVSISSLSATISPSRAREACKWAIFRMGTVVSSGEVFLSARLVFELSRFPSLPHRVGVGVAVSSRAIGRRPLGMRCIYRILCNLWMTICIFWTILDKSISSNIHDASVRRGKDGEDGKSLLPRIFKGIA